MIELTESNPQLKTVLYCGVCSLPCEYCEFHPSFPRCKQWLLATHPSEYSKLYPDPTKPMEGLSLSVQQDDKEKTIDDNNGPIEGSVRPSGGGSRGGRAQLRDEAKLKDRVQERLLSARLYLRTESRSKRKSITAVGGLDAFGVDLKKAAKRMAGRFACGASVQLHPGRMQEEVVLQGEFVDELVDWIPVEFPTICSDQIDIVDK